MSLTFIGIPPISAAAAADDDCVLLLPRCVRVLRLLITMWQLAGAIYGCDAAVTVPVPLCGVWVRAVSIHQNKDL